MQQVEDSRREPGGILERFHRLDQRQRIGLSLTVTLLVVTLPFVEVLAGRRSAMYADINDAHVPMATAAWRAIRHGHSPFWSPLVYAGHNLLGAGQAAIFYPPNALFGWLSPVTAFRWWLLFHVWLAAGGAFAWSWHRWRSLPGAMVSGIGYGLNGFLVLHILHMPLVATAAWLPFAFLGLELVIERWSLWRASLLAVALAEIAFTGHPQGLWQTSIGLGVIVLARLAFVRGQRTAWVRASGGMAIGFCLGAVQTLPLYLFSRTSARPKLSRQGAFLYSDEPRHLITLAVPRIMGVGKGPAWGPVYHELANYLGITVLALAVIGVVSLGRDRFSIGLLVIIVFGLFTAIPAHTPVGNLVYDFVPLAHSFRAWSRNLILVNVSVACLAGAGVRAVLAAPGIWRRRLGTGAAAFGLALALLPSITDLGGAMLKGRAGFEARAFPVLLLLVLLAALATLSTDRDLGIVALIAVCAIDLIAFTVTSPWRTTGAPSSELTAFYSKDPPAFGVPADEPGGIDRWVTDRELLRAYSLVKDIPGINGYDPLVQADFSSMAAGLLDNGLLERDDFWQPGWLNDVLRVTTLIVSPSVTPTDPAWHRDTSVDGGYGRWVRTPRLADAYLVGDVRPSTLVAIRSLLQAPATDLTQTAYVEPGHHGAAAALGPDTPGPAGQVLSGSITEGGSGPYEIDAIRPALLVISSAWLDGWSATVDGHAVPVTRANGLVLGIPVTAGRHTVKLHFTPPGFHRGLALLGLGACGLAGPSIVTAMRRRRPRPAGPDQQN